jgi:hypothetical protein
LELGVAASLSTRRREVNRKSNQSPLQSADENERGGLYMSADAGEGTGRPNMAVPMLVGRVGSARESCKTLETEAAIWLAFSPAAMISNSARFTRSPTVTLRYANLAALRQIGHEILTSKDLVRLAQTPAANPWRTKHACHFSTT